MMWVSKRIFQKVQKKKMCMTVGGKDESTYSFSTLNGSKASFPADNNPRLSIFVNNFSFSWILSVVVVCWNVFYKCIYRNIYLIVD